MYFTRDPVVETVITAREGHKLTIRSTGANPAFEPLVVEALEVVSLGGVCFLRNSDRSKSFLLPAVDYEIFETRDARVNLKALGLEKGIKIAGGRTASLKIPKEKNLQPLAKNGETDAEEETLGEQSEDSMALATVSTDDSIVSSEGNTAGSKSKKSWKEKRQKHNKKKSQGVTEESTVRPEVTAVDKAEKDHFPDDSNRKFSLLPPPALLISEVMSRSEELGEELVEEVLHSISEELEDVQEEIAVALAESSTEDAAFVSESVYGHGVFLDPDEI